MIDPYMFEFFWKDDDQSSFSVIYFYFLQGGFSYVDKQPFAENWIGMWRKGSVHTLSNQVLPNSRPPCLIQIFIALLRLIMEKKLLNFGHFQGVWRGL